MSTYKMASYFALKKHEVYIFSFAKYGHIDQNFAKLYHAESARGQNNSENLVQLENLIKDLALNVVINQMPYEHGISEVLVAAKQKNGFLLLGCLRNTLFSVVKNLDSYRKKVLPAFLQPFFANSLGKNLLLQKHKANHAAGLKRILNSYDYFVMFGPPNQMELEYFVGNYKKKKVAFIPNSIPAVLDELPKKEKVILYLSRLDYTQKRADLILPLWKKLLNELADWRMEIVGGGPALEDIKNQIIKEKIPRVEVFGKQKPDDYYRNAAIYIMTSAFEGFPNTLIEAQSFGAIPVIYDNYPMAGWVANNEKDAFLVTPFNVDQMAKKVLYLAQHTEIRQQMAQSSLENANRFTIEKVGQIWLDFFEEKLQDSK